MEILVDRNGYEQFLSILNELKSSLENIASGAAEVCRDAVGDGWHDNFAYDELMRDERKVSAKLKKMLLDGRNIKIIKDVNSNADTINIGDTLKVEVIYAEDDIEVFEVKLTGKYLPDSESSIQEISLNSQMGRALYLKNVHNKILYKIHDEEVEIKVLEKNGNIVN